MARLTREQVIARFRSLVDKSPGQGPNGEKPKIGVHQDRVPRIITANSLKQKSRKFCGC